MGIFSFMNSMFSDSKATLPETMDWNLYIPSEPDFDEIYDYTELIKLYNAQYRRKRAAQLRKRAVDLASASSFEFVRAQDSLVDSDVPPPPIENGPSMADTPEQPEQGDDILKIEMDAPEGVPATAPEPEGVLEIGYEPAEPLGIEYNKDSQNQPKQITQQ
jgi:hypothetical protein